MALIKIGNEIRVKSATSLLFHTRRRGECARTKLRENERVFSVEIATLRYMFNEIEQIKYLDEIEQIKYLTKILSPGGDRLGYIDIHVCSIRRRRIGLSFCPISL